MKSWNWDQAKSQTWVFLTLPVNCSIDNILTTEPPVSSVIGPDDDPLCFNIQDIAVNSSSE